MITNNKLLIYLLYLTSKLTLKLGFDKNKKMYIIYSNNGDKD